VLVVSANVHKKKGKQTMDDDGEYGGGGGGGEMDDVYDNGEDDDIEEDEDENDEQEGFEVRDMGTTDANCIPVSHHTTTKYMTKYERARVLGTRALQIR
jgi:DNA-directed RNA polymerases I, II, and III subunit RPABC2